MATVMRIAPGEQPSWTPRPQTYKPQHAVFNSSAHEVSYAEALLKSHRQPSDALVTETNYRIVCQPSPGSRGYRFSARAGSQTSHDRASTRNGAYAPAYEPSSKRSTNLLVCHSTDHPVSDVGFRCIPRRVESLSN